MVKQKIKMEVGKRYKGYGLLNEYGEYTFEPCQVETNPKNMHILKMTDNLTVYESDKLFKVAFKVSKELSPNDIRNVILNTLTEAYAIIIKYGT